MALFRNGEAAEVGGFLQLLYTTMGDDLRINQLSRRCIESEAIGWGKQASEDLKDLRVRFGALAKPGAKPMMGFGTEEELVPLAP